jgi:hypothetical protein
MMNPTELDVRVLNYAARIACADRIGSLYYPTPAQHVPRRAPWQLCAAARRRLSLRLTPEQVRPTTAGDGATA